jgi:hypothetical protein
VKLRGYELAAGFVPSPNNHGGTTRGMRSVGISFFILVARIVLIVFFDSLTDSAVGVAAVAALLAGIIWLPDESRSQWSTAKSPVTSSTIQSTSRTIY